ncbi:MAG: helicase-exonuclease AddAB subunit AddA [Oscillospiraceae bacterium]|jgi:ATP-dependent helicase/nuclease subunit A|nr:helicase-exonuclease AddAB subunit AddA [Oscillospiraceae bacterium]
MSAFAPTGEQELAIRSRGSALLVSAAAGSGKTRVLVERLLGYITDPGRDDNIDDFLIITYTRAAAGELRGRILGEIAQRLSESPGDANLRRQYALCGHAQISTIHGFCAQLLRQSAHRLGMSPDFRVADETECALLKARALDDVLDARCDAALAGGAGGGGFDMLADMFFTPRGDRRLQDAVLDVHGKLRSHPYPDRWIARQLDNINLMPGTDAARTVWGEVIIGAARRAAAHWLAQMRGLREEMGAHPAFMKAYGRSVEVSIAGIEGFLGALDEGWDAARARASVEFPLARVPGYEELKEIRTRCSKGMKKVAAMFECGSEELMRDMDAIGPVVSELLRLAADFDSAYSALKRERGAIDFSDQEHLALALLVDGDTGLPTETAKAERQRFTEILVDEYQDVNAVQELIFGAVSRGGGNIFMVGDARQSIYGFRLADPTIFLKKYREYSDVARAGAEDIAAGDGRRVLLTGNFRSRAGILDAVNYIFENIMSAEFGGMEYTRREFLSAGRSDAGSPAQTPVELDVLDLSAREDGEPEHVALRIEELMRAAPFIPDGQGGMRAARLSDFAILLRSVKNKAARYFSALGKRGIPAVMPAGGGFFEEPEIMAAMALLSVIDNPMQDIALISALRGPVYGFTADELAGIRLALPDADFYTALRSAACSDAKCRAFTQQLDSLREAAPDMSADRFIFHVYSATGLPGKIASGGAGKRGRENLMRLAEYARQCEANGYRGLFGFVSYMRRLAESGREPGESGTETAGDAVRIMSVHKSKGLEFPVVILADTAKRPSREDMKSPVLVHSGLGVGIKGRDVDRRIEYQTLARAAVARALADEACSEELRVLYVALTRAREKLIMVCALKNAERTLRKLRVSAARPVPAQTLIDASCAAEWILLAALTRPESHSLTDGAAERLPPGGGEWDMRLYAGGGPQPDTMDMMDKFGEPEAAAPVHECGAGVEELKRRFEFVYPNAASVDLPSKLTVTELKGKLRDAPPGEDAAMYIRERRSEFIIPATAARSGLRGAERGTAIHLVMQRVDYSRCGSEGEIAAEVDRLVRERHITPEQGAAADIRGIAAFFKSGPGEMLRASDRVFREFGFSLLTPARELFPGGGDDEILFQGVIDCAYVSGGELTVIDFKTDSVTEKTLPDRARGYEGQLRLYAVALKRVTGLPVARKYIYFFSLDRFVDVD